MVEWYALDVERQKEYLAGYFVKRMGCDTFIPTETRWRRRNRYAKRKVEFAFAALPGVIFVGVADRVALYRAIDLPMVSGVLSISGRPMALDAKQFDQYRAGQVDGHLVVERVKVLWRHEEVERSQRSIFVEGRGVLRAPAEQRHMRSGKEFKVGERVTVASGPLRFETVTVKKIVGARAQVLLPLFGGMASIPLCDLESAA